MEDKTENKTNEESKGKVGESKDSGEGLHDKTTTDLDRADSIAERLKRENDRREKLLEREEALAARRAVGGTTEAGGVKETAKEETPKEYRARVTKELAEGKTEFGN